MLLAAQILPMGLQPSGAGPDASADEAGASEAFGALLRAETGEGGHAQTHEKSTARIKAASAEGTGSKDGDPALFSQPGGAPEPAPEIAPDIPETAPDIPETAPEASAPGVATPVSEEDAAPAAQEGEADAAPATDAEADDATAGAPPRTDPGRAAGPDPAPAGSGQREIAAEAKPARNADPARAAAPDTGTDAAQDAGMEAEDRPSVRPPASASEDAESAETPRREAAGPSRPAAPAPSGPAPDAPQPQIAPGAAGTETAAAEAEAETGAAIVRAEAPAGQAAAQAADGEAVSRAAAQMETEDAAPRRERLAAAHIRGEGETRAERAAGDPAPARPAERPQPPSAAQPQHLTPSQPQPPAQQTAPQPQPGPQGQAPAALFTHPAGMRADAEPMPVRASEPAPETLTETARIERAAADPARNPASQLQGQPHGPRLVPGHAAAMAGLMARRFSDGARVFDIRLDPAELGRVDVRMTMGKDGKAQVLMTAERAEALSELQRTHRDLARELEEAGIELAEDGLSFELASGDDGPPGGPDDDAPGWIPLTVSGAAADETGPVPAPRLYGFALNARTGVDVRA